jgi:nitrogen-specific signal transduction histidine kinase
MKGTRSLTKLCDSFGYPACVLAGEAKMYIETCNNDLTNFLGHGREKLIGKHINVLMEYFLSDLQNSILISSERSIRIS